VLQLGDCLFLGNNVISCEITLYKDISGHRSCSNHPVCLSKQMKLKLKGKKENRIPTCPVVCIGEK